MSQTLIGVIYDQKTLAPRRVVFPHDDSHLDGRHVSKGEAMAVIHHAAVPSGFNAIDLAYHAIRLRTGREPPPMHEIQAVDKLAMTGAR